MSNMRKIDDNSDTLGLVTWNLGSIAFWIDACRINTRQVSSKSFSELDWNQIDTI